MKVREGERESLISELMRGREKVGGRTYRHTDTHNKTTQMNKANRLNVAD